MPDSITSGSNSYVTARRLRFAPGPTATSPRHASIPANTAVKAIPNEWGSATLIFSLDHDDDYQLEDALDVVDFIPA
ncbi:hypothetical protein [Arthrobacter sp. S2(2024)]|uniref:hypothetical protein n=1 Tax=Arthrobacter sp. S2(2024) TaxID=3111911 RepID=UPI002FCB30D9